MSSSAAAAAAASAVVVDTLGIGGVDDVMPSTLIGGGGVGKHGGSDKLVSLRSCSSAGHEDVAKNGVCGFVGDTDRMV